MRRTGIAAAAVVALSLMLSSCALLPHGVVDDVQITIGRSTVFDEAEIEEATQVVIDAFYRSYHDCELIDLWYDEGNLLQDLDDANTIVLLSNHTLGSAEADDGFEPGTVREEWQWHLTRTDAEADSELLTAGYG